MFRPEMWLNPVEASSSRMITGDFAYGFPFPDGAFSAEHGTNCLLMEYGISGRSDAKRRMDLSFDIGETSADRVMQKKWRHSTDRRSGDELPCAPLRQVVGWNLDLFYHMISLGPWAQSDVQRWLIKAKVMTAGKPNAKRVRTD